MTGSRCRARGSLAALVPVALLVAAPTAGAQVATPSAAPDQTVTAPAPEPAATVRQEGTEPPTTPVPPPTLKLTLSPEKARGGLAFKGDHWRALVVTDKYVPGVKVTVSFAIDHKRTITRRVPLEQAKSGDQGVARAVFFSRTAKRVVVHAHIGKGQPAAETKPKTTIVNQMTPSVQAGNRGPAVRWLQAKLKAKGYVIGEKGLYDARTQRAVLAFRKVLRMARTTSANSDVFRALQAGRGAFKVRFPSHGRHVEGDISRQVIALIGKGGKVERIYHTSSGAPATPTIRGSFRVYMKDPGTNAKGMYKSSYFIRGYAVHGYPSVPTYNASHGCFRVPMADAASIFAWMTMGTIVDTY
ncbi:L,D-transpeptidase family protein [Patulibacter defluvii]|uniref:L,D-transpeptidase family protein n=1 Tax=Patulibacter defluvii TaxID=3095358 RepID=UPI002A75FCCE|nr:L,D-transpeptidase family protein [Patulibacter sp. DM4]